MSRDGADFRHVLGHYPTGVCLITASVASAHADGEGKVGLVVGSFTSVSLDPPLVGFFPARGSTRWCRIADAGRFCVNILAEDQQPVCDRFARRYSGAFAATPHRLSPGGAPLIDGVVAWIDCDVHAVSDAGDHLFVTGQVRGMMVERTAGPLLFCKGGYGGFSPAVNGR